ncbi:MAG: carbon starvation protein A [Candidatus Adiutrix sp.]|jgi:carbon starvation protein CstA|nr:carbon starvation protein A [Candidatus Adiutrix sp.]
MPGFLYLLASLTTLLLGFYFYSRVVEKIFRPDENRRPPALSMTDGVDYIPDSPRRVLLNQFLCITGTGPVFGPILGILYGPQALLWIVLGAIFGGAVHDYLSGMMSIRYRGESIPNIAGYLYGPVFRQFMRLFSLFLLIVVGAIMAMAPAGLLSSMTRPELNDYLFWLIIIFTYYFFATIMPIEMLLDRFNPFFTCIMAAMAVLVVGALIFGDYPLYQMATQPAPHPNDLPMWPLMFITIACGAISGFHATQSTISARCLTNEKMGRQVFYGAMIMESVIALIWATAGMTFYQTSAGLAEILNHGGPARVVRDICFEILGELGGLLAVLGVVILPITSGDTAFRSARLLVADIFNFSQKNIPRRILIAVPLFAVGIYISLSDDFSQVWRYFAWLNQSLACFVLWSGAAYLVRIRSCHWIATIPAVFMTAVVTTYILYEKIGLGLPYNFSVVIGLGAALAALAFFLIRRGRILDRAPYELTPTGEWVTEDPRQSAEPGH